MANKRKINPIYIKKTKHIISEYNICVNIITNYSKELENHKVKIEAIGLALDNINTDEQKQTIYKLAKDYDEIILKISTDLKVYTDKMNKIIIESKYLYEKIKTEYYEYTDEELQKLISEQLN